MNDSTLTSRRSSTRRGIVAGAAALGSALALTAAVAAPATAAAAHRAPAHHHDAHHPAGHDHRVNYVALGDSLASGLGIPDQVDAGCGRSSVNYPRLVAADQRAHLTDVSCASATTAELAAPQGDVAPAQFKALSTKTDLVTVTIGVNDIGFSTIIGTCAQLGAKDPAGSPCRSYFTSGGTDQLQRNIKETAPKISAVLSGIHRRAPHAKVLLVGYPVVVPDDGVGCTSASVPFARGDFGYLRDTEKSLNSMLAVQARHGGAEYVDTYKPSIGHDMCKAAGTRWLEPVVPPTPAAPTHPNALGHRSMAAAVERSIGHLASAGH